VVSDEDQWLKESVKWLVGLNAGADLRYVDCEDNYQD
jgi:hypothetical protein